MYLYVPDISWFYWNTASINLRTPSRKPRKKMWGHQSSGARAPELWCPLCSWLTNFHGINSNLDGWILTLIQVFLHAVLSLEISIKSQIVARLTKGMMLKHRPSPRIAKVLCAVLGCLCSQRLVLKSCPARWILVPVSRRSNYTASWTKALWCHFILFTSLATSNIVVLRLRPMSFKWNNCLGFTPKSRFSRRTFIAA